jgi:hexosaminidase
MSTLRCERRSLLHLLLLTFVSTLLSANSLGIIPQPQKIQKHPGSFILTHKTHYHSDTPLADTAITYLKTRIRQSSGYTLENAPSKAQLVFHYSPQKVKKPEGYHLEISTKQITVTARDREGFFYGIITLLQLTDPVIWSTESTQSRWTFPACHIEDAPRYRWRGMMLDVSRNFFSVAYVKKFIDRMAQYKLNRFHWHLTDDEGWRIEIKQYPLLTKIGAKRGPGTKLPFSTFPAMRGPKKHMQSGYYTQQQIKEIVAYAKARCIEILPEIDLPAHAKAAVTAYPDLLLDPGDTSHFRSVQKVANNTLNPALESTYMMLEGIVREVAALFPFGYIHLGGDEVPKGAWRGSPAVKKLMRQKNLKSNKEVENYFFSRMDKIAAKYGKHIAGWQEITDGRPAIHRSSLIIAWKSPKAGKKIIQKGYPTIMAPVQYLYFDQQYVRSRKEPGHTWSTPVSLHKAYSFSPPSQARGIEACLWSETLLNEHLADYLTWPRALALSEVAWSITKNWNDFRRRVKEKGLPRLKVQEIHYRKK